MKCPVCNQEIPQEDIQTVNIRLGMMDKRITRNIDMVSGKLKTNLSTPKVDNPPKK